MTRSHHFSDEQIAEMVSSEMTDSDIKLVGDHLESCKSCQTRLETAAADGWWWNQGRQLYSSAAEQMTQTCNQSDASSANRTSFDPTAAEVNAIVEQLAPATHPELPGQIDEYQVEQLIGIGGMGVVFKAFDRELNRPVAIKFLAPRLTNSGIARQRFAREAKATAAICHDNVIPIFRINTNWIFPFFVMPYIPGVSLDQFVKERGALAADEVVQIAAQISSGLSAAHKKGLIHRDIKPANILLQNRCNRVVITDFGLVRDENEVGLTQTGVITGTPQFMSPEQIEGNSIDSRTDLFSLGSVMYWMATGCYPFRGHSQFELLSNIRKQTVRKIRSINPGIPIRLEQVIEKCLQKNPSRRFRNAEELETLLNRFAAHLKNPVEYGEPGLLRLSVTVGRLLLGLAVMAATALLFIASMTFSKSGLGPDIRQEQDSIQSTFHEPRQIALSKDELQRLEQLANLPTEQLTLEKARPVLEIVDRVRSGIHQITPTTFKKLSKLRELNSITAERIMELWKFQTQSLYGRKDLFVVEICLLEAQLLMEQRRWKEAASQFSLMQRLLKNNFAKGEFRNQVAALETMCLRQIEKAKTGDPKQRIHHAQQRVISELYPGLSREFKERLDPIRNGK